MSTILQLVNADKSLSNMTEGLKAAQLEETLNGFGPFTILAPINLAFGKLALPDTLENLVKESKDNTKLSDLLSFHVITGKKMLRDFRDGQKLQTVGGRELTVTVKDGEVQINGARILAKDRQGSNGVVHSIDRVNLLS
ncbi:MAG: fasciclin domain-containing protein [Chitinophagaceae bacterium]